jgi:hypothetical protein
LKIDFLALARDGMNIVLGAEGSGVFESIGPLISGADDRDGRDCQIQSPEPANTADQRPLQRKCQVHD